MSQKIDTARACFLEFCQNFVGILFKNSAWDHFRIMYPPHDSKGFGGGKRREKVELFLGSILGPSWKQKKIGCNSIRDTFEWYNTPLVLRGLVRQPNENCVRKLVIFKNVKFSTSLILVTIFSTQLSTLLWGTKNFDLATHDFPPPRPQRGPPEGGGNRGSRGRNFLCPTIG